MSGRGWLLGVAAAPVVRVERDLDAAIEDVWSAWTEPDRLRRWLGATDVPRLGTGTTARIWLTAREVPDDPDWAPAVVTVGEVEPPRLLRFGFVDASDAGGQVMVVLQPLDGGRTRLVLEHALAPVEGAIDEAPGFGAGWEAFLVALEAYLAGRGDVDGEALYRDLEPRYAAEGERLRRVRPGSVEPEDAGTVRVRHDRWLAAPAGEVWAALTGTGRLERWLGHVVSGALAPGGTVDVLVDPDAEEHAVATVLTWRPPERLELRWAYTDEEPSAIAVTLVSEDGGTRLVLEHSGLEDGPGYAAGWHAHLDLLAADAEGRPLPPWDAAFAAARGAAGPATGEAPEVWVG